MIFTDHFFLLYFFPAFLFIYFLISKRVSLSNIVIIIASLLFYASFGLENVLIFLIPMVIDFILGIIIFKARSKKTKKILLAIGVIGNLGVLAYFKYTYFFLSTSALLFPNHFTSQIELAKNIIIPVGISFIIFQRISYIVDIYRKKIKPSFRFLEYATYATLFPHLISGPIVRYSVLSKQLKNHFINAEMLFDGFKYFVIGITLKILIADRLFVVENLLRQDLTKLSSFESLSLILFFSLRIYLDFTGYSLIAIGIAKCMGFNFPHNFDSPYRSTSVTDFWRRWNITLSLWLRDYVYIPLGGNRKGKIRTNINLFITMFLGGLWHGASWNFVIWGCLHGIYLITERTLKNAGFSLALPNYVKITSVFILISFTWLTFLFTSPSEIVTVIKSIGSLTYTISDPSIEFAFLWSLPSLFGALLWAFVLRETYIDKIKPKLYSVILLCLLFLLAVGYSLVKSSVPFIYFQF